MIVLPGAGTGSGVQKEIARVVCRHVACRRVTRCAKMPLAGARGTAIPGLSGADPWLPSGAGTLTLTLTLLVCPRLVTIPRRVALRVGEVPAPMGCRFPGASLSAEQHYRRHRRGNSNVEMKLSLCNMMMR